LSLRPRYSLLTLLILTALVAGGVKLWYGPHHVVEQISQLAESEYTYTRNWQGEKIIHGPHIERISSKAGGLGHIQVTYYRKGQRLKWDFLITKNNDMGYFQLIDIELVPNDPIEDQHCKEVIQQERERFVKQGSKYFEWYLPDRNVSGLIEEPERIRE
jgi:hypothetical protein